MKLTVFIGGQIGSAEKMQDDSTQMVERCVRKPAQGVMVKDR